MCVRVWTSPEAVSADCDWRRRFVFLNTSHIGKPALCDGEQAPRWDVPATAHVGGKRRYLPQFS